jgi:outer membrane protein OmpA-like peptidoglycan-associated protein/tetratricopeptide (TPR) repeat protein
MIRKIFTLTVLCLLLSNVSFSKGDTEKPKKIKGGLSADETLKLADRYYAESLFYSAEENYRKFLEVKSEDRYANYWMGMAAYQARDYEVSEEFFAKFYSLKPGKKDNAKKWDEQNKEYFKLGNLYYGMALHRNGKCEEAKKALDKFRREFSSNDDKEYSVLTKLSKIEIAGCDSMKFVSKAKVKVKIFPKTINKAYTESAPFLNNDNELYYTSMASDSAILFQGYKNYKTTAIYVAKKNGRDWSAGKPLDATINEDKYITGNGTFNKDRTRFYFTKCMERDDDRSLCNIFVADVVKGKIQEPKRLPEGINFEEKYTATQPTIRRIDSVKEFIYYISDAPGGKGGMDVWVTERTKNGEYIEPRPLGGKINTVGDEVTPFFDDSTNTLYFSSDGHPGYGGFDIFKSTLTQGEGRTWTYPANMGKPINSGADELYFTVAKDETNGTFTSNRKGTVPLAGIATASDDIFSWENFNYAVDGDVTKKDDATADMSGSRFNLYRKTADGKKELIGVDSISKGGKYFFKLNPDQDYVVEVERPGYLSKFEELTTKGLDDEDTLNKKLQLDKDGYVIFGKVIEDDKKEPKGIMGANLIVYEIINGQERMFKESVATDSFYYITLPTEKDFKILARKEGYFAGNTKLSTKGLGNSVDSLRADIYLKKVEINKEYKLNNILYEFGKATLTDPSKLVLDTLYDLLAENPSFVIELSSHTDSVGSDAGNMKLSQARAQSCVDYLIKKGIEKKRMIPMGYGKRKPIAPNSTEDGKDNPDGRALNRRTEFKILKM